MDEEIQKALTQFEVKALEEKPIKKEQESNFTKSSKLVESVISHSGGMIKDQKQAEYALLGFVVIIILITIFIFVSGNSRNTIPAESLPEQLSFTE